MHPYSLLHRGLPKDQVIVYLSGFLQHHIHIHQAKTIVIWVYRQSKAKQGDEEEVRGRKEEKAEKDEALKQANANLKKRKENTRKI